MVIRAARRDTERNARRRRREVRKGRERHPCMSAGGERGREEVEGKAERKDEKGVRAATAVEGDWEEEEVERKVERALRAARATWRLRMLRECERISRVVRR